MNTLKFILLTVSAFLIGILNLHSIPATPKPIKIKQADGSEITINLHGDEFFHYETSLDGFLISQNDLGIYEYAQKNISGSIISTGVKVREIDDRTISENFFLKTLEKNLDFRTISLTNRSLRKSSSITKNVKNTFPLVGSPKSLIILVNFKDKSFITVNPLLSFTNLLNEQGYKTNGGTGSAKDYFKESSNGIFTPQFEVVGPYTLPQVMSYYGDNVSNNDKNPQQMIIDACKLADDAGVDFTQYDIDGNGIVDNIFIYYAGNNEAEGASVNTIWPHRWTLSNYNTKFDNKVIYDYACTSELRDTDSDMCGIGTFCHEFGHVLGLVDYYPTNKYKHHTLSDWNIMDNGAYLNEGRTPPTYSAFDRFFLNWLKPAELKTAQDVELPSLISSNKAFLITQNGNHNLDGANPSPIEFFTLENRQRTGFDSFLPGSGLLITRIYYNAPSWWENSPNNISSSMGVDIIEADGIASESSLAGDPFPGATNNTSFTPVLRDGTVINKPLKFIYNKNGKVGFKFMGGNSFISAPVATQATEITKGSFVANWNSVDYAKGYYLTVYNLKEGESTISEGFDKGLEAPVDWKINSNGITFYKNFSGKSIPALVLKDNHDSILTETYPVPVKKISFYIKAYESTISEIKLEGWNGTNWSKIDDINVISGMSKTLIYNILETNNYTRFKFKYNTSNETTTAIDDISVTLTQNVEYICKNKWKNNLTDTLYNLVSSRVHYYKLLASDVDFNSDNTKIYEILSTYSNTISLETLPYNDSKNIRTERDLQSNDMLVFLEDTNQNILIYNTSGQLIANIKPTDLKVNITNYLTPHNIYIISVGNRFNKIIF